MSTKTAAPRVLALLPGPVDASFVWRICQPMTELADQGYITFFATKDMAGGDWALSLADRMYDFDALILPRATYYAEDLPKLHAMRDTMHRLGKCILGEHDDDQWLFSDQQLTEQQDQMMLERNKFSVWTTRAMDGLTVSTPHLAGIARMLTDKPVVVVPNLIDLRWFRAVQARATRVVPPLTIGWFGAKRQDADLEALGVAWGRIARRYPRVRFVVAGHTTEVVTGRVPADRLTIIPYLPIESYPIGLVNIDIGCASVANNEFNRSKSIIKCLEFGARGRTAVVASPTLYDEIIRDHDTGYLAETADEWEAALSRLVEDGALRRALARRLGAKVERDYSLQIHAHQWLSAWRYLIDEFKARQARKVELWVPGQVA